MGEYEKSYQEFIDKRMKPRRKSKMINQTVDTPDTPDTTDVVADAVEAGIPQEQAVIYQEAAALFRSGDKEGALNHIRTKIGDEAAKEAELVMSEIDLAPEEVLDEAE